MLPIPLVIYPSCVPLFVVHYTWPVVPVISPFTQAFITILVAPITTTLHLGFDKLFDYPGYIDFYQMPMFINSSLLLLSKYG